MRCSVVELVRVGAGMRCSVRTSEWGVGMRHGV